LPESDLISQRLRKVQDLRERGVNPYPYRFKRTYLSADVIRDFERLKSSEETVSLAGRIMSIRMMGKASFSHIQDRAGRIQIYVRRDSVGDGAFETYKLLDIGDFIGVTGNVFRTRTGEITLEVKRLEVLCKAIRQLPIVKVKEEDGRKIVFDEFADKEQRYRRRYVDLVVNPDTAKIFETRSKIIRAVRRFLDERGFLEVETPTLQPVYGGANARPFVTHHNALDMRLYLRISPELYLKRLIVGGLERVYDLSKNFRNEGIDRIHNPEFTMLELYQAYADFNDMMELTEQLYRSVVLEVKGTTEIEYQGVRISFEVPWRRIRMTDALKEYAGIDVEGMDDRALLEVAKRNGIDVDGEPPRGMLIHELFEALVEDKLVQPTFVTHFPKETTPLCKVDRSDPRYIERFEPYINGWEMGNAYSELNDPVLQRELLERQSASRRLEIDDEKPPMDEDFVRALEYGMPPTGGLGLSIDRMVMLLTDQFSIRDVILFPQMRPE